MNTKNNSLLIGMSDITLSKWKKIKWPACTKFIYLFIFYSFITSQVSWGADGCPNMHCGKWSHMQIISVNVNAKSKLYTVVRLKRTDGKYLMLSVLIILLFFLDTQI